MKYAKIIQSQMGYFDMMNPDTKSLIFSVGLFEEQEGLQRDMLIIREGLECMVQYESAPREDMKKKLEDHFADGRIDLIVADFKEVERSTGLSARANQMLNAFCREFLENFDEIAEGTKKKIEEANLLNIIDLEQTFLKVKMALESHKFIRGSMGWGDCRYEIAEISKQGAEPESYVTDDHEYLDVSFDLTLDNLKNASSIRNPIKDAIAVHYQSAQEIYVDMEIVYIKLGGKEYKSPTPLGIADWLKSWYQDRDYMTQTYFGKMVLSIDRLRLKRVAPQPMPEEGKQILDELLGSGPAPDPALTYAVGDLGKIYIGKYAEKMKTEGEEKEDVISD